MWVGIAGCVAMGLYPPWKYLSEAPGPFGFLYSPPTGANGMSLKLDLVRLCVEWCIVGFVTIGLMISSAKNGNSSGTSASSGNSANGTGNTSNGTANSSNGTANSSNGTAGTTNATSTSSSATSGIEVTYEAPVKQSPKTDKSGSTKAVKFPDFSVGEVLIESQDDSEYWDGVGEARGTVYVPTKSNVQLEVLKEKPMHLVALKDMDPHALQSIDFSESAVTDEDLSYISHFSRLYEIDLSHTSVTDDGIEHLANIHSLRKIWLDNTKITEAALDNLKKLQQLDKVSLTGTDISESSIKSVKESFPRNCEIIMASGTPA